MSLLLVCAKCQSSRVGTDIGLAAKDIPDQEKMTLQADIMYKSNWQQGALKGMFFDVIIKIPPLTLASPVVSRRNKWICALKTYLAEAKIYGPKGDPDKTPDPDRYTLVPWEEVRAKENKAGDPMLPLQMPEMPVGGYDLINRSVTNSKFPQRVLVD